MLNTNQQIEKLNKYDRLAKEALKSKNIVGRIGAFTVYAGMIDFMAIQSARLLEQIILKGRLVSNEKLFKPHEDSWFYDERVSTRRILKEIKKFLPFESEDKAQKGIAQNITDAVLDYIKKSGKFLGCRNTLIHHIGNPKISEDKIKELLERGLSMFKEAEKAQSKFFKLAQPFRFSKKEVEHFYNKKQ